MAILKITTENVENKEEVKKENKSGISVSVEFGFKRKPQNKAEGKGFLENVRRKSLFRAFIFVIPSAVVSFLEVILMMNVEEMTNAALEGNVDIINEIMRSSLTYLAIILVLIVIVSVSNSAYRYGLVKKLKYLYLSYITELPINSFETENSTKYLSSVTSFADAVDSSYFLSIFSIIQGIIQLAAGIYLAIYIDWRFLLISLIILVMIFGAIVFVLGRNDKLFDDYAEKVEKHTKQTREILQGFDLIKQADLNEYANGQYHRVVEDLHKAEALISKKMGVLSAFTSAFGSFLIFFFFVVLFIQVRTGNATVGRIIFMLTSILIVLQPGITIFQELPSIKEGKAALKKMNDLPKREHDEKLGYEGLKCEIKINNLAVGYGEKKVFEGLEASIKRGDKVLVTGPSGSGKSSLLKVLRKYMVPLEGQITVDGGDLKEIAAKEWFEHTGYLSQKVFLLDDTLENNITLRKGIDEEKLYFAIENAGLLDFVKLKPEGLKTHIDMGGYNVSGGERVRIAIARALYHGADLLLLDEPFAALDVETALYIEDCLLNIEGLTIVNVSHVIFPETMDRYNKRIML